MFFLFALPLLAQSGSGKKKSPFTPDMQKLQIAQLAIRTLYVDSVDERKLTEEAIRSMLSTLDPHSSYTPPKETKQYNEPLEGNFDGIGIQFNMTDDTLFVVQTVVDGPSERVGILPGDRIITADGRPIAGQKLPNDSILSILRGPKGSKVQLQVLRRGEPGLIPFTVTRDKIPVYSVDASYMAGEHTGYVRISRFAKTTHEEFIQACRKLKKQGMKDLILDLEGNGGGYLGAAVQMADEFLQERQLIVYTQGRAFPRQEYFATGKGKLREGRLVVLVNDFSASAAEILAGAVQDWDRGVIVGRRTFGKGLVQYPVNLPDGSMIRLTTAKYYTPAGRRIQKPYKKGDPSSYNQDLKNRIEHGELMHADSIHFADSLKCQTQLLRRTVYGGGGIMPDLFVPADTSWATPAYRRLSARGLLIKWAIRYTEQHRAALKEEYRKFEDFNARFRLPAGALDELKSLAAGSQIEWDEEQIAASLPTAETQFKALVARNLWGMDEYFQIINTLSDSYTRALSILQDGTYEQILSPGAEQAAETGAEP